MQLLAIVLPYIPPLAQILGGAALAAIGLVIWKGKRHANGK